MRTTFLAILSCCLLLILSACGGGGGSSNSEFSEAPSPPGASTAPGARETAAPSDPCDFFSEADYEAVMGAKPEAVERSESSPLSLCTRESFDRANSAVVAVARASEDMLDKTLQRARSLEVVANPIETPEAQMYLIEETNTLYAYKNGVYLEVTVKAAENSQGKGIELAKRVLERVP